MTPEQAENFRSALSRVKDLFAREDFKGRFYMGDWGIRPLEQEHLPDEKNYCETAACLAGWIAITDPEGFGKDTFWEQEGSENLYRIPSIYPTSRKLFGLTNKQAEELFYSGMHWSLEDKLAQAEEIIQESLES